MKNTIAYKLCVINLYCLYQHGLLLSRYTKLAKTAVARHINALVLLLGKIERSLKVHSLRRRLFLNFVHKICTTLKNLLFKTCFEVMQNNLIYNNIPSTSRYQVVVVCTFFASYMIIKVCFDE